MDNKTESHIKIVANQKLSAAGKLASAEIEFSGGLLDGLRLVGFGIWKRNDGGRNVTLPARQYLVNSQPRMYPLLQPVRNDGSQVRLREAILAKYAEQEAARKSVDDSESDYPDLPRP